MTPFCQDTFFTKQADKHPRCCVAPSHRWNQVFVLKVFGVSYSALVDTKLSLSRTIGGREHGEQRRTYPAEQKRDALEMLTTSGTSGADVARDLGIESGLLNQWRREEAQEGNGKKAFPGQGVPRDEELVTLRKEVADLRGTNEILKKRSLSSP